MQKKHKAVYLLRDLLIPVAVLLCVGLILWTEQQGYKSAETPWYPDTLIDQDRWEALVEQKSTVKGYSGRSALLVTAAGDEGSIAVSEQVSFVLSSMFVDTQVYEAVLQEETDDDELVETTAPAVPAVTVDLCSLMPEDCTDVILCTSAFHSAGLQADSLSQWVKEGGRLMIATSLEYEELTADWYELLGIAEVLDTADVQVDSMYFENAFLVGAKDREFSEEVINCTVADVKLSADSQVKDIGFMATRTSVSRSREMACRILISWLIMLGASKDSFRLKKRRSILGELARMPIACVIDPALFTQNSFSNILKTKKPASKCRISVTVKPAPT